MKKLIAIALAGTLFTGACALAAVNEPPRNQPVEAIYEGGTTALVYGDTLYLEDAYAKYAPFGLVYDKATNTLHYNGILVRCFEDFYALDDNAYGAMEHYTEEGLIDVYTLRDASLIQRNPDGSYDPSDGVIGLAQRSEEAFKARVFAPADVASSAITEASVGVDVSDGQKAASGPVATAVEGGDRREWAKELERYTAYGLRYDVVADKLYYGDKVVRYFEDILRTGPSTYDRYMTSTDMDGEIDVKVLYDEAGEIVGIGPFNQAEFDAHTKRIKD